MNTTPVTRRLVAATLLAIFAVTTFAPAALAGHRSYKVRRYRGPVVVTRVVHPAYIAPAPVVVRQSNAGPAIACLVGGLILGAAIANSTPAVAYEAEYRYYDPYCQVSYATLDECRVHISHHPGPRIVRVVDVSSGQCVHSYQWCDGWRDWND